MSEKDLETLRTRLAALGVREVAPLAGGASSLTYQGTREGRPVVVKVAPAGHAPVGHRDVLRQARIMRALAAATVPVPEVLLCDAGAPPDVPPLFVARRVEGETFEPLFDVDAPPDRPVAQRFTAASRTLAALHAVPLGDLGLADEPVVDAAAEVDRWSATLRTVDQDTVPGWPGVRDALLAGVPAPLGPSVVHGDFRLGNMLAVGSSIAAVIDWEIWSVGDPRIDVGWFLANADPATYARPSAYVEQVPSRAELLDCYGVVPDVDWFVALACFKSAATWSLIVKHNRRRSAPRAELEAMAPVLPRLLRRAEKHLA